MGLQFHLEPLAVQATPLLHLLILPPPTHAHPWLVDSMNLLLVDTQEAYAAMKLPYTHAKIVGTWES